MTLSRPACSRTASHLLRTTLLRTTALVAVISPAAALAQDLPTGGQVVAGSASIATADRDMTVTTGTQRTVIDWSSFSIGTDHRLTINQPDAASINVNRVTGSDPSKIFGTITSNGRVVIANPNGIWFGPTARVDVAGIVAAAGRISDASVGQFIAGGPLAIGAGNANASVVNDGVITARLGGFAALVAPGVRNSGTITARLGQVALASGRTTTVDFYGDGLINLSVAGMTDSSPTDAAVGNSGSIYAEGGQVRLSANVAEGLLNNVINMSGAIEARGVATKGGVVELLGGSGSVEVSGKIDVSGTGTQDGGHIAIKAGGAGSLDGVLNLTGTIDSGAAYGKGGSIDAEARFASISGSAKADAATGGDIGIKAIGITQTGRVSANATSGKGGTVILDAGQNITQTLSAVTSANSVAGAGGAVIARTGAAGRTFSSGTLTARGTTGGTVEILGNDIALAAATVDASGTIGKGGAVLVGGDLHGTGTQTAATTLVNGATTLIADGGQQGDGGRVVIWSDQQTDYQGSASARGGAVSGNGGMIEASSGNLLNYGGSGDAGAAHGAAGTLLLDPKNIVIEESTGGLAVFDLLDPNSGAGTGFGTATTQLSNGTAVITKPLDTVGGVTGAGSVYFYDSRNGGLLSALQGSRAGDNVGSGGFLFLNYKTGVASPAPDNTTAFLILSGKWNSQAGAVTWVGANSTVGGVLSSTNSLVGGTANDKIGIGSGTTATISLLSNSNYVVRSQNWGDSRGAATFGTAAAGVTGVVSASNSIVGSLSATANGNGRQGDQIGQSFVQLANDNFVILSPYWNRQGGALSWGSGTTGFIANGVVSASNSLVGTGGVTYSAYASSTATTVYGFYGGDNIAGSTSNVVKLTNGNAALLSSNWDHGKGAVTLIDNTNGITGTISSSNSLVGVTAGVGDASDGTYSYYTSTYGGRGYWGGDNVGTGIVELTNGALVVRSSNWGFGKGAATYFAPGAGVTGTVTAANSLTGTTSNTFSGYDSTHQPITGGGDYVSSQVKALANGNYVVASSSWNGTRGAVTLMDGTTGQAIVGSNGSVGDTVSSSNSLVGSNAGDAVGATITPLIGTSDFVASTSTWTSGRGAVTKISGTTGIAGAVSSSNSLVGTISYESGTILGGDNVGATVRALSTGGWVILSPNWNKTRGAATFVAAGATITGTISASNSLVGTTGAIGNAVYCMTCSYNGPDIFGGDQLGSGGIKELTNGNFLILSPLWNSARGAITFVNGTTGALVDGTGSLTGSIGSTNSLVGDQAGTVYTSTYNYSGWNNNGRKYYIGGDQLGSSNYSAVLVQLANGNFVLQNSKWHTGMGAVTFGTADGKLGDGSAFAGVVSSANSLVGSTASNLVTPANATQADYSIDYTGSGDTVSTQKIRETSTGDYFVYSEKWSSARGAITWGSGTTGITGAISAGNSLVGSLANDRVGITGSTTTFALPDGSLIFTNQYWKNSTGAVTWAAPNAPLTGTISASNSFIGSATNDKVGSGGVTILANGTYVINSASARSNAGAVTWSGTTGALTGTLSAANSFIGSTTQPSNTMKSSLLADSSGFLITASGEGSGHVLIGSTDPTGWTYARAQRQTLTIAPSLIAKALNSGTSIVLQANNDITINSALTANAGATGNLTLEAGRSILGNASLYLGTGSLTLLANNSVSNGVVDAYRDSGNAVVNFAAGTSITTNGGAVSITLANSTDKTNNGAGGITLGAINAASVDVRNLGSVNGTLTLGGAIGATGTGTSILLATGGAFSNTAGANSLDPGAGRFLVYSADPRNNVLGGLTADGKFYGRTLTANPPGSLSATDNLFLYSVVPTLTVTGNTTVGYGDSASSVTPTVTGFIDGDTSASALSGAATTSTLYQAGDAVGGSYALTIGQGTLASSLGYALNLVDGTVTVTPKQLGLAMIGSVTKDYDRTTAAALSTGNYQLTGLYGSDSIAIGNLSGNFASANVGTGLGVTVTLSSGDFTAGGATQLGNYVLPTGILSATIGSITPKTVSLSGVTAQSRAYDGTNVAVLTGGTLAGVISGDTVNVSAGSGLFADKNVGIGKAVSLSGYSLTGANAGNYILFGQPSGLVADITAKALTLSGVTAQDRDYDGTTVATLTGGTLSGIVGGDDATLSAGTGSFATKDAGVAKGVTATAFTLTGADAANYSIASQPTGLTATISAKTLTLSGVTAQDRAYDGTTAATLVGGTLSGILGSDAVTLSAGIGSFANKNAGTNKAVAVSGYGLTGTDAGNYALSGQPTGLTATISAVALNVLGVAASDRDYDGTTSAALTGGTLSGVLGNDAVTLVTGSGAFLDKNAGVAKTVTLAGYSLTGADAVNYTLGQPSDLTATIHPRALTLSGVTAIDRVYDGTATVALSGGTLSGTIGSDAISLVSGTGSLADRNVGIAKAVTATGFGLSGMDAGNYVLAAQPTGLVATITAKTISLTGLAAQDRDYDGTTAVALSGGTLSGLVGSDTVGIVTGTGTLANKNVGIAKTVTITGFGLSGTDAGNYVLSGQPTGLTATIAPRALTLSGVTAIDRDYDGTTAVALSGGTLSGIVGSDAISLVSGTASLADKNVGIAKTVTATGFGLAGADAANYSLGGQPTGLLATISARTLNIAGVQALDSVYDGTTNAMLTGGTLAGLIASGDVVSFVSGTGSFADKNVGVGKAISVTGFGLSGADAGNYALSGQPGGLTATVTARTLVLGGVTAANRDYDGTTVVALSGGTLSGIVGNDAIALQSGTGALADKNVGVNKAVTVSGFGLSGTDAGNYVLSGQPTGLTATIAPRALTLSGVTAIDRDYDGTTAVALSGGTLSGIVGSDAISLVSGTASLADKNVGIAKTVTATGFGLAGADAANYSLGGQPTGLLATISARTLNIAGVQALDSVYDGTTNAMLTGGTLAGLIASGDVVSFVSGTGSFADKNVGVGKAISVTGFGLSGADAGNYALSGQPGGLTATVTARTLVLGGVTAANRDYDGTTAVALSGGTLSGIVGNDAVALQSGTGALADKNVGVNKAVTVSGYGLSGADAANYALSGQPSGLSVTIAPRAVSLSGVTAVDRDYDGTTGVALTPGTLSGLISTDAVSLLSGTGSMADKNAGTDKAVAVSGFGLTGTDASNYAFAGVPNSLVVSIARRAVTLSGVTTVDRAYDGTTAVALSGGTLSGPIPTDAVSLVRGSGSVANANAGSAKPVTVSGFGLSGMDAGNYALADQPAGLSVAINPARLSVSLVPGSISKTYDGTAGATLGQSNYEITGLVNGETISIANMAGSFASANAGNGLGVSVTLGLGDYRAGSGTALRNYALPTGTLTGPAGTILKAALLVHADDKTKVSGDAMPTLTVRYTGFKGSDSAASTGLLPTLTTSATAQSPAGSYAIQVAGGQLANYAVTYQSGSLGVTAAPVPVPIQALIANQPVQAAAAAPVNVMAQNGTTIILVGNATAFIPTVPVVPTPQVAPIGIGSSSAGLGAYETGAQSANGYANSYLSSIKLESQQ